MESIVNLESVSSAKINIRQCVICQEDRGDVMTKNPRQSSYATLLSKVKERASYLVRKYMLLQKALGEETPSTLADKGCTWYRSCYQDVTNNHIKREHGDFFSKSNAIPPQGDPSNKKSRRSDIEGFSVGMCVLCQSTELDAKGLHQIETA